ncbi:MAG: hypothetical protein AB7K08_06965 [Microbacteriaceae bacterium]|jgi:hypothetical protein
MRKYLFSIPVLSAVFSFIGLAKTTATGPRDWRLILMWVSALAALGIAVGTVIEKNKEAEDY